MGQRLARLPQRYICKRWWSYFQDNGLTKLNTNRKMQIWNRATGTILILINLLYFLPVTFQIMKSGGEAFGYGVIVLPITIIAHLFLIPSIMTWTRKDKSQTGLLIINSVGLTWAVFWFAIFTLTPRV